MITTDYNPPYKFEFRITKTDVKKAIKAILKTDVYHLTSEFQSTLDSIYNSIKFRSCTRHYKDGEGTLEQLLVVYEICGVDVTFLRSLTLNCYASNYGNTTSDDFTHTLMNTLLPIMLDNQMVTR